MNGECGSHVEALRKAIALLREAETAFGGHEIVYHAEKLEGYAKTLFERFAPWRAGDTVRLSRRPKFEDAPGWSGSEHFLIVGARGVVRDVDCRGGRFVASVEFEDESWRDRDGVVRPVESKHVYMFDEDSLVRV